LAPGETTVLEIKNNCEWAGVKYKMMKNKEIVGYVAHSFRDKNFSLEISQACKGDTCNLTGLPPAQSQGMDKSAKK
jgi:hypothetical protein